MRFNTRNSLHHVAIAVLSLSICRPLCAQAPAKKTPIGPPSPQSMHYPVLLVASGNEPSWSLHIGQKGPERLDRFGYPPIPLEPNGVTREGTTDAWNYRAKDTATGAEVSVHLTREACSDTMSDTKYTFRVAVEHTQIGPLRGCARFAPELFPRLTASGEEKDTEDDAKSNTPAPTITNFKLPFAIAYLNPAGNVILKRGQILRTVADKGFDLSLSHDGKKLLFAKTDAAGVARMIFVYDLDSGRTTELLRGQVRSPLWSPDDSRIAFLKLDNGKWQLWISPANDPLKAAVVDQNSFDSLGGWADSHTILASDLQNLLWISDDGNRKQTLALREIFGAEFEPQNAMTIQLHPANLDLLLMSALFVHLPAGVTPNPGERAAAGLFLYELRSKRRVSLPIPGLAVSHGEWSRDGLQIFFTGASGAQKPVTYRIFWDGTDLRKHLQGTNLVIGQ